MSKQGAIHRYTLIIEKLKSVQLPTFEELKHHMHEQGFEVSDRTIQRDIEQIRYEFGIEIAYNRGQKGYYIDYEKSVNVESFFRFLEIANTSELLSDSLHESKNSLTYITFDEGGGLLGIENLKPLLQAVKEKREVSFVHYNFQTDNRKDYILRPYLLKEYQKRWYVIGIPEKMKEFRTFGIDRIENLKLSTKTFKRSYKHNPVEMFENIIGVVCSAQPVEEVILSFSPIQGKYIKTLPLHSSQKILVENESEFRISIHVVPNFELNQLILKYGQSVKVMAPDWLRIGIKDHHKRAFEQYL